MLPTSVRKSSRDSDGRLFLENITELKPNDDEEERRLARRRTFFSEVVANESGNLAQYFKIHKGTKISHDNAWSLSLIDTLTDLLERHHNSLNNFRVACPTLESSSRVYGLRVDSVYEDVMRISTGLAAIKNCKKRNAEVDDIDGVDDFNEQTDLVNKSVAGTQPDICANQTKPKPKPKPKERATRQVSTVTKNKETLNGILETIVPMDDVIFGKLNRVGGSINSSKHLMNNVLETNDYNLKLSTKFRYWTAFDKAELDYTLQMDGDVPQSDVNANAFDVDKLEEIMDEADNNLFIRSLYTGYTISKKNKIKYKDEKEKENTSPINVSDPDELSRVLTPSELAVQFDMDAKCEPVCLDPEVPMLDVDFCEYEALTSEEITAINRCQGLRRSAQIIEDLRPIDSSSQLEYSYRPLNNISKFWIGPSHWKFKIPRPSQSTLTFSSNTQNDGLISQRALRAQRAKVVNTRSKPLTFGVDGEESLYLPYDKVKNQQRRDNIHKKWDQRKLKLPTDLHIEKNIFMRSWLAPRGYDKNSHLREKMANKSAGTIASSVVQHDDDKCGADNDPEHLHTDDVDSDSESQKCNDTVLKIHSEFDGAPSQVTKIVVPFAKHARHIDMQNLKSSCKSLLDLQFKVSAKEEEEEDNKKSSEQKENNEPNYSTTSSDEKYQPGQASFAKMYSSLPDVVSQPNASSLTPTMSFYALLHLASENNLRLSEAKDSDDIIIRKIQTEQKMEDNDPSNS